MAERAHPDDPGFQDRPSAPSPYRQRLVERYAFCDGFVKNKRVLDVPCGTGWGSSMLQGYAEMHGIDISDEAVAFAAERFGRPNMHFMRSDMASLPFDDSTKDVVICLEGFEHVPRETGLRFLHEAKRVLAPGGLLLMTCPVLDEYGRTTGNPYHVCEYPEEELIKRLNHMFSIVELARIAGPDGPEYRAVLQNFKPARYRAVSL